jgi:tetratricopeptide (TPR) repeat protein
MTGAFVVNEQLRFGEIAVEFGYLDVAEVRRALREQVRWKIVRSFQLHDVTWQFEESSARLEEVGHFPMRTEALLLDAVRWVDDETKMDLGLRGVLDERLWIPPNAIEALARRFELCADECTFLARVDGALTTRALLKVVRDPTVDVHALLTALIVTRAALATSPQPKHEHPRNTSGVLRLVESSAAVAISIWPSALLVEQPVSAERPRRLPPPLPARARIAGPALTVRRAQAPIQVRAIPVVRKPPPLPLRALLLGAARNQFTAAEPVDVLRLLEELRRPAHRRWDPDNERKARMFVERALVHMREGRPLEADRDVRRAIALNPQSMECRLYRRWYALQARRELPDTADVDALRVLAMASLESEPELGFGHYVMEWCADRVRGDVQHSAYVVELRRCARVAVATDPNFAFGYYVLGNLALEAGHEREALRYLKRAQLLDSELLDTNQLLSVIMRRIDRANAATQKRTLDERIRNTFSQR